MSALIVNGKTWRVDQMNDLPLVEDKIKIKITYAGLCRTDIQAMSGQYDLPQGRILGHEGCGVVEEIPDTLALKMSELDINTGDRVAFFPFVPCKKCPNCQNDGEIERCHNPSALGLDEDGIFAKFAYLPIEIIFKAPKNLSFKHLAYAEPVSASLSVLNIPKLIDGDKVAIIGKGRIAKLTSIVLNSARDKNNPVHIINPDDILKYTKDGLDKLAFEMSSYDAIIETYPDARCLALAVDLLKFEGLLVCKSRPANSILWPHRQITLKRIKIEGSPYGSFQRALDMMANKDIDIDDMLGDDYPLTHQGITEALERELGEGETAGKLFFKI